MWLGAWVCLFCTSRRLIRLKWSLQYQCQYFTIHSSISECDHKCETWNTEPEIGTDMSDQTRRNPRVDGYGSGFGPPKVGRSGFWPGQEPNRPVFVVQTRAARWLPGPVAITTDISWVSQNHEIGRNCIIFNQVSGSFISSLRWPIAMLDMWNPTADWMLLILHLEISLTNLEPLQSYFICLNCICSVITITITITIIIPVTLTTISTPEALISLLVPSFASSPSPRTSQYTNSLHEALSQPSSPLLTIVKFNIVQSNRDWFTCTLNHFA